MRIRTAIGITAAGTLIAIAGLTARPATATTAGFQHPGAPKVRAGQTAAPDFTCPARTVCLYPNDDYTGNYANGMPAQFQPADIESGVWHSFGYVLADSPNYPGSVNNNTGTSIWVYDHQEPAQQNVNPICIPSNTKAVLDKQFGHFEEFYSNLSCTALYTIPLP